MLRGVPLGLLLQANLTYVGTEVITKDGIVRLCNVIHCSEMDIIKAAYQQWAMEEYVPSAVIESYFVDDRPPFWVCDYVKRLYNHMLIQGGKQC